MSDSPCGYTAPDQIIKVLAVTPDGEPIHIKIPYKEMEYRLLYGWADGTKIKLMSDEDYGNFRDWAEYRDRCMMFGPIEDRFELEDTENRYVVRSTQTPDSIHVELNRPLRTLYAMDPPNTYDNKLADAKVLENFTYGKMWLDNQEQYTGAFWYNIRYYIPGLLKRISSKYNGCNAYPPSRPL